MMVEIVEMRRAWACFVGYVRTRQTDGLLFFIMRVIVMRSRVQGRSRSTVDRRSAKTRFGHETLCYTYARLMHQLRLSDC